MGNPARLSDERGPYLDAEPPVNYDVAHENESDSQDNDADDTNDHGNDVSDPFRDQIDEPSQEVGNAGNIDQNHTQKATNDGTVHVRNGLADEAGEEGRDDQEHDEAGPAPTLVIVSRGRDCDAHSTRQHKGQHYGYSE